MTPKPTMQQSAALSAAHGGQLVNRIIEHSELPASLQRAAAAFPIRLDEAQLSDLVMLATGVCSPLEGFMNSETYGSVVAHMRLPGGLPWSLPITLAVSERDRSHLAPGMDVALCDSAGRPYGLLFLEEIYQPDKAHEARQVYGTDSTAHPGVARLMAQGDLYLAGPIVLFELPAPEFPEITFTPQQTREIFAARGWRSIVAFQTRNPVHRAHEYLQKVALESVDGLLLHPLIGETKADDIPADIRVESYQVVLKHYFPQDRVFLSAFPAAMRYAGPREAVFHALCRKNYGCTHFIVVRDHAGVGQYYGTYDAQRIFDQFDPAEIGIQIVCFENAYYSRTMQTIVTSKTSPYGPEDALHLSGTQVRAMLERGEAPPPEFTRPEVSEVLIRGLSRRRV